MPRYWRTWVVVTLSFRLEVQRDSQDPCQSWGVSTHLISSRVRHKTIFGGNLMSISQLPQGSSHGWGGGTRGLSSVREEMAENMRIEWPSLTSGQRFKSAAIILRGKRVLKPDRWCSPRKQKVTWLTLSSCTWEYDFKSYAELKQRVFYEHIGVMTAFSPGY